jgi:hypothetical protein
LNIVEGKFEFKNKLSVRTTTKYCFLHHAKKKNCTPQDVHRWHQDPPRNWSGFGYHFFIAKDGLITTGRPIHTLGAQAKGYNNVSLGICFEGDYEVEKDMPSEQFLAGQELLQMITFIYHGIEFLKHSEKVDTLCPGQFFPFYKMIDISTLDKKKKTNCVEIVSQKDEEIRLLREQLKRTESILEKNREYTEQVRKDYQEVVRRLQKEKSDLEQLLK